MALGQTGPAPKPGKREKAERPKEAARAEVKKPRATAAPKETPLCKCGCGEHTKGGTFRPGHDARFHAAEKAAKAAAEQPVAQ